MPDTKVTPERLDSLETILDDFRVEIRSLRRFIDRFPETSTNPDTIRKHPKWKSCRRKWRAVQLSATDILKRTHKGV